VKFHKLLYSYLYLYLYVCVPVANNLHSASVKCGQFRDGLKTVSSHSPTLDSSENTRYERLYTFNIYLSTYRSQNVCCRFRCRVTKNNLMNSMLPTKTIQTIILTVKIYSCRASTVCSGFIQVTYTYVTVH